MPAQSTSIPELMPNHVYSILELTIKTLFKKEYDLWFKRIGEITLQNNRECKLQRSGFIYNGTVHRVKDYDPSSASLDVPQLSEHLHPKFEMYLKEWNQIETDSGKIKQILFKLITPCESFQGIRDAIPDCLLDVTHPMVRKIERVNEELWPILDDTRALKQYYKVLPLIQYYTASRLLI